MIHTQSEAWTKPFVAVFEPAFENTITSISLLPSSDRSKHVAMKIESKENRIQYIFQGTEPGKELSGKDFNFDGFFGVVSLMGNNLEYMYLGKGKTLSFGDYRVTGKDANCSFHISFSGNKMNISCNQELEITIKQKKYTCKADKNLIINLLP